MNGLPDVSIVIPVRNEAPAIERTIDACLAQDYAGNLEIVVADGMSTDGTREVVAGLARLHSRVRLVDNPSRTAPGGLNRGVAVASGSIIVRCDAHSLLPPGYVQRAVAQLQETGAANVGGIQRAVGGALVQRAIAMAMTSPLGVGDARYRFGGKPGPTDTVYLGTFRRDALEAAGGFNERMIRNQDYELNYRLRQQGGDVWFDPQLVVDYAPRGSLKALARQYFDYGLGKRRMLRLHPRSLRWRQLAAPLLVIALGGTAISIPLGAGAAGLVVPAAYAAALMAGAGYELVRSRDAAALVYPLAVGTMHLAWGVGFLAETLGVGSQPDPR